MGKIDDLFAGIVDEAGASVGSAVKQLLKEGKADNTKLAQDTAQKVEKWLKMRVDGDLDDDDLKSLLEARKRTIRQALNTFSIKTRAKLEKVSLGVVKIALKYAIGALT